MSRTGLEKNLGLVGALTLGIGTMIGAGIFVLSGVAARAAGPASILSFVISGATVLLTALSFAELATALPKAGGPYVFVKSAFPDFVGFITGWSLWIGLALTTAFYSMGFGQYLSYFLPLVPWKVGAVVAFIFVVILNVVGAKEASRFQTLIVTALLATLALYIVRGLVEVDTNLHHPFLPYGWPPVFRMAAVVFVSFLGFELIATAAEEIRNPRVNLPLATLLSVVIVTILYAVIVYVASGLRSYVDLGQSPAPIADTAQVIMGPFGAVVIVFAGLLATLSSANASIMAAARILYALGRDGFLTSWVGRVHPRWRTPLNATLVTGIVAGMAVTRGELTALAGASGFLHLYPFLLVNLALLRLRGTSGYKASFRIPGGSTIPILAILSMTFLLFQVSAVDMILGGALVLPGALFFLVAGVDQTRFR